MAKTKQAPLPWTLTKNSWQYTTIYDAEGNSICRLDLEDWSVTEDNQDALEKVQTQIAERIVKAANNHVALVRALTEMLEGFEPFTSKPMGAPGSEARNKQQLQIAAHRNARAALNAVVERSLGQGERS